jgi:prepilin-type N-terminal cleavage/methylation domain-containing protein
MSERIKNPPRGFSFLELLVTILIVGLIAAMIAPFFGSGVLTSHLPIQNLQAATNLKGIMENINGQYLALTSKTPAALQTLQNQINATQPNLFTATFGAYQIDENQFIRFVSNAEVTDTSGSNSILKVTISKPNGGTLTQLFTAQ